jgi:hypothetical protein
LGAALSGTLAQDWDDFELKDETWRSRLGHFQTIPTHFRRLMSVERGDNLISIGSFPLAINQVNDISVLWAKRLNDLSVRWSKAKPASRAITEHQ